MLLVTRSSAFLALNDGRFLSCVSRWNVPFEKIDMYIWKIIISISFSMECTEN